MIWLWRLPVIALLTVLTLTGGIAWLIAIVFASRRTIGTFLIVFAVAYTALWGAARFAAPQFNRTAIPCIDNGPTRARALNPLFCLMNRTYVSNELADLTDALATHMHDQFPGSRVRVLDGGFPVFNIPLLPHLSHNNGNQLDLDFWYEGGNWRSPIGYWAFEQPRPQDPQLCDETDGFTLRWNMTALQPWMRDLALDEARTAEAVRWLAANLPENGKLFIEPHLADRLAVTGDKIRFQGCNAARHDDHIHIQL
ncbi:MAG: hypothetical protein AAGF55_04035 [Pseudomonadota bacterium]